MALYLILEVDLASVCKIDCYDAAERAILRREWAMKSPTQRQAASKV